MLYRIRFDTDHGYDSKTISSGHNKWSLWFENDQHLAAIGFCHITQSTLYKPNTYYLFLQGGRNGSKEF